MVSEASSSPDPVRGKVTSFEIGSSEFLLDGKPFVIRCGEIHFPRVPRAYWRHRLQMCRAMGLNTVCAYLFWNFHEWNEGEFDWSGQADAAEFCRIAQEEGLWVLLRPGPYSCAEWEMGGLPWWLAKREGIQVRSTDPAFLEPAVRYLQEVGRVLSPLQASEGGPILMVQVENEYGSFGDDAEYMGRIREALGQAGFTVPLFACNPPSDLRNGLREDLFQVVNFGIGASDKAFAALAEVQPTGPRMNGEYYPAWFDMWGRRHRTADHAAIAADLDHLLTGRHSFSIYMAHGGTSFGMWAGADRPFSPDTSSYDYDAPISEAGWATPKFEAIRAVMERHLEPGEHLPDPPSPLPVIEVPPFELGEVAPLLANLPAPIRLDSPCPIEKFDQSRGATLYRTVVPPGPAAKLRVAACHDFGWVSLGHRTVGILDRRRRAFELDLAARDREETLDVLVYTMGRVNFGREVLDRKGLHGPVTLDEADLLGWDAFPLPLDGAHLGTLAFSQANPSPSPAFYRGGFHLDEIGDTFLDVRNWGKGVVWVNGHALGRYWNIGPTQTMFLPGAWLQRGWNEVVVLDMIGPSSPTLAGLRNPILDELRLELDFSPRLRALGAFAPRDLVAESVLTEAPGWHSVPLCPSASGRYLCLEAVSVWNGGNTVGVAEIDLLDAEGNRMPKSDWKPFWASSEETNYVAGHAENAIDGQSATSWFTERDLPGPHRLVIDLGTRVCPAAFRLLPPSEGTGYTPRQVRIFLSETPFGLTVPV